jgi:hypothetical protein
MIQILVPNVPILKGWVNGDLYKLSGEKIGILPVSVQSCAMAVIKSYSHADDQHYKHAFLAREQGTKYAVMTVHTKTESSQFIKFLQEHPAFKKSDNPPDWKSGAKAWNRLANGVDIFYKVNLDLIFINCLFIAILSCLNIFKHIISNGLEVSMRNLQSHRQ